VAQVPHSLGFKLALGWREQQRRGELPPYDGDLYEYLRQNGLDYIEFSVGACLDRGEVSLLRQEAFACADAGLAVSLHPYLGAPYNPALFGEAPEAVRALEAVLAAGSTASEVTGSLTRLVVHPASISYQAAAGDMAALRRLLLARSQAFFAAAEERLTRLPKVRAVVEHQVPPAPGEAIIRIGDTYAELLEAVRNVSLGLCWDTGHYLLSVRRCGQSVVPLDEFLRRVEAVHLHDVVGESDHQIISPRSSQLRDYVCMLRESGFSGGITLEYSTEAIRAAGSLERVVTESVAALSSWVA
jgi:sugar phosphate isomerase/epimerase